MLKRLELIGFKSFAEKTIFDFTAGVTAIVGPNGSGKSNIVDAVRWILGEQSAKSLRGGEMADVIFNGSASRKSLGLAEVTMTFDNAKRALVTEADEVQITRRVYRTGEGEYLINGNLCRLKDIKELFLGSGAGHDAYCIIEQGKVDVLLQSSTKDRRTIFEEAAGISRFKAKRIETLRKLERVDQNLLRLTDIIDEVEKQLRSVKLQATKAQKHQEHSTRLKELRISLGLDEYRQFNAKLAVEVEALAALKAEVDEHSRQIDTWSAATREVEEALARLDETVHDQESRASHARQQIAAEESTLSHEWHIAQETETDIAKTRSRLAELDSRLTALAAETEAAGQELTAVETQGDDQRAIVAQLEERMSAGNRQLKELQARLQEDKLEHLELIRQSSRLQNEVVGFRTQVENLNRERDRLRAKNEQASANLAAIDQELSVLEIADEDLQSRLITARQSHADHRQEQDRVRQQCEDSSQRVSQLRAERSGLESRIEVLDRLERSQEGLGTGVRELLALMTYERQRLAEGHGTNHELAQLMFGLVADLISVRHESAPLVDLMLGETAQRFLVRDPEAVLNVLRVRGSLFTGRVSLLPLQTTDGPPPLPPASEEGLVAYAKDWIRCDDPNLAHLPQQLLGRTLIVRDMNAAWHLRPSAPGYRLVTLHGEILEADGTVTVGAHHAGTGILSRKSELRELREQAVQLDVTIADTEKLLAEQRLQMTALEDQATTLQEDINGLTARAADMRSRLTEQRNRRNDLNEEVTLNRAEIMQLEAEIASLDQGMTNAQLQVEKAEREIQDLHTRQQQTEKDIRQIEHDRQQQQQELTTAHVALAQVEERLSGLAARHRQFANDLELRKREREQARQHQAGLELRLQNSQLEMLRASASQASWCVEKELAERHGLDLAADRERQRRERHDLAERTQRGLQERQVLQDQSHARELSKNDFVHRLATISDRLRDDYQVDLAELARQAAESAVPLSPDDVARVNEEIEDLRRKLTRLGGVNLDSLQELAELELRAQTLQMQSGDLTSAKRSLEEIIAEINHDSRRLFTETFSAIRAHFQELFRKLFGGGMADIVLEDENDVLESGIEIIARPPGKELRSISLMSGGEKTLTAVALLLAIFRSKPSPFCLLDEVDAALDEANIARYTAVVRDFLDHSQFIIITHSKKTMAAADVLYGITMQESGVSKQVAVRFEDWPDDNTNGAVHEPVGARNGA